MSVLLDDDDEADEDDVINYRSNKYTESMHTLSELVNYHPNFDESCL